MRAPRIVFYAVNGLGLGHVTRLLAIARAVRNEQANAEILFLTTSEASHLIYREGFAAVKFPSRAAAQRGNLRAASWQRLMHTGILSALTAFDPHILVADTFPAGSANELLPALRWIPRRVFVFRAQRMERAREEWFQNTLRQYDLIVVPHRANSEAVPIPETVRAIWTGPITIRETSELLSREQGRAQLGFSPDEKIALLTLGGGGDSDIETARITFEVARRCLPAVRWIETRAPLETSPSLETSQPAFQTACRPEFDRTQSLEIWPLMPYLRAFDWAIAAAGYNTVHELQAAHVPSILWPFKRDVDDQAARVQNLAKANRALALPEGAGADDLKRSLEEIARDDVRQTLCDALADSSNEQADAGGAQRAAKAILGLLN